MNIRVPTTDDPLSLKELQTVLKRPLPPELLQSKVLKGHRITFISWHDAVAILDKYAPGWQWEIKFIELSQERIFLVGRLTIWTPQGFISREASGTEMLETSTYGDPSSNAESMAFRRCCAKFGLGLYLYKGK